ncbi:hypothetical protein [Rhodoplanes sp. SY1]|uniref:hypothetical protein n=1 Tax=Rhodoplanes sp. SY1 TaxID=3166646 RepID=UPI0038B681A9
MNRRSVVALATVCIMTIALAVRAETPSENPLALTTPAAGMAVIFDATATNEDRLLAVNGRTSHVIFEDGYSNRFCVLSSVLIGDTAFGCPVYRNEIRCR